MIKRHKDGYVVIEQEKQFGPYKTIHHARRLLALLEYRKYEKVLSIIRR